MNEFSILDLFFQASLLVQLVMILLLVASLVSWVMIIERLLHFKHRRQEDDSFEKLFWNSSNLNELFNKICSEEKNTLLGLSRVFHYAFKEYSKIENNKLDTNDFITDNVSRSIRIAISKEEDIHSKNLDFLANVGSVSPYIGLFGTVIGIVNAFQGLSDATQATINAVAPGISEALLATALGLFAAIPAVIAFNRFTVRTDAHIKISSVFGEELVSILNQRT